MLPDLTSMMNTFLNVFKQGRLALLPDAKHLLWILASITITWSGLMWAFGTDDVIKEFVKKVLFIGVFVWLVTKWDSLLHSIVGGFVYAGTKAGGSTNTVLISDPSAIMGQGLIVTGPIFSSLQNIKGWNIIFQLQSFSLFLICGLLIIIAFIILAAQVFITYVEFGIISTLAMILLPFGVFKPTAFIAEKAFGAIISFGVKLMVLSFIISVAFPMMQSFALPPDPTLQDLFTMVAACFILVALAWHAPGLAAGLLSGSPVFSAATAASAGVSAFAGAAGGAALTKEIASGATSAAVGATKAAAGATGALHTAAEMGGPAGVATYVGSKVAEQVGKVTTEPFQAGARDVHKTLASDQGGGPATPSGGGKGSAGAAPDWAKKLAQDAKQALPQEASPSGGMSAPITHDS